MADEPTILMNFLTRLRDTDYLPDWANDQAGDLLTDHAAAAAAAAPIPIEMGKWCPFARVSTPIMRESNNRSFQRGPTGKGMVDLQASLCVKGDCQLWTGSGCGLMVQPMDPPVADPDPAA